MDPRPGRRGVARSQMTIGLELTRSQILAFRRRAAALDERLPRGQARVAACGVGRFAGQHAARRAALDPCAHGRYRT